MIPEVGFGGRSSWLQLGTPCKQLGPAQRPKGCAAPLRHATGLGRPQDSCRLVPLSYASHSQHAIRPSKHSTSNLFGKSPSQWLDFPKALALNQGPPNRARARIDALMHSRSELGPSTGAIDETEIQMADRAGRSLEQTEARAT